MYIKTKITMLTVVSLVIFGCNNGPKVITPSTENENQNSGIFAPDPSTQVTNNSDGQDNSEFHKVVINEVLAASRYIYLNVTEEGKKFWIATRKQEVEKGETYFYRGGLLKTNFESKEHNRVFDTIYLISNLVTNDHAKQAATLPKSNSNVSGSVAQKEDIPTHTDKIIEHKGSIKIADLVKDPKKYEGHTVQISGKCVKTNPGIMDRNWIHIQDGSKDDYDLVITSDAFVPEGNTVTLKALVTLNKDFGAGYKYDLILENGTIVQ